MYILFWRGFVIFILFIPWSGLCTIQEKVGTSYWVLVRLRSIRSLPRPPSIVSFLFPKTRDVTNERTNVRKKNPTFKVSLCCKRTGSKNVKTLHWRTSMSLSVNIFPLEVFDFEVSLSSIMAEYGIRLKLYLTFYVSHFSMILR